MTSCGASSAPVSLSAVGNAAIALMGVSAAKAGAARVRARRMRGKRSMGQTLGAGCGGHIPQTRAGLPGRKVHKLKENRSLHSDELMPHHAVFQDHQVSVNRHL